MIQIKISIKQETGDDDITVRGDILKTEDCTPKERNITLQLSNLFYDIIGEMAKGDYKDLLDLISRLRTELEK